MISALNDGRPSAASECWMWRRIWVGGKNGCSWDSRESGCDRSITRTAVYSFPAISLHTWTIRGINAATIRSPVSTRAGVASPTTPDSVMSRSMSIGTTTPGPLARMP